MDGSQTPSPDVSCRFRRLIDRYQVLALSKPLIALWLLEWLELFVNRHLE